jgi:hypothetical protein
MLEGRKVNIKKATPASAEGRPEKSLPKPEGSEFWNLPSPGIPDRPDPMEKPAPHPDSFPLLQASRKQGIHGDGAGGFPILGPRRSFFPWRGPVWMELGKGMKEKLGVARGYSC